MNSTKTKQIYQLIDPRTDKPFYIGQSTNASNRLEQHIKDAYDTPTRKRIKAILDAGLRPTAKVIEVLPERKANARERELIKSTPNLTNLHCNSKKGRKKKGVKKQAAWARQLLPKARKGLIAYQEKEKAARVVPEISVKAWEKIEPYLETVNQVDTYDLMGVTGYTRGYVSKSGWLRAIAESFPDTWELTTRESGGKGRPKNILRRVSP